MTGYSSEYLNVEFYPQYMTQKYATKLFHYLLENIEWKDRKGKRTAMSYGDPGCKYSYTMGGYNGRPEVTIEREVLPWSELPKLEIVRDVLAEFTGIKFNYCVVQLYPNGNAGIKPHKDKEMNIASSIVGISLGATRVLTFTPPAYNRICKDSLSLDLLHGSMYNMLPPTNKHWKHSIEVDPSICEPRISLTFRNK